MEDYLENLINELGQPRMISPSPAAIRAAKALQELHARANQDTQARIKAEHQLMKALGDIQRLTKELNDAKENIAKLTNQLADASKPSVPDVEAPTDEVSSG